MESNQSMISHGSLMMVSLLTKSKWSFDICCLFELKLLGMIYISLSLWFDIYLVILQLQIVLWFQTISSELKPLDHLNPNFVEIEMIYGWLSKKILADLPRTRSRSWFLAIWLNKNVDITFSVHNTFLEI